MNEFLSRGGLGPVDETPPTILSKDERERILAPIDTTEREVLKLRFGLDTGEPRTLAEVGQLLEIGADEVRAIEASAMMKLREHEPTDFS